MNPYQILANDITALQVEQGDACPVIILNGATYKIQPGSAMLNKPLRDGGFSQMFDLQFMIVASQFFNQTITDANSLVDSLLNKKLSYLGKDYKVMNVHVLPGATLVRIEANSFNQRA